MTDERRLWTSRRELLRYAGHGLTVAGLGAGWSSLTASSVAAQPPQASGDPLLQKPMEPPYPEPRKVPALPPEQRVGFAIVGLGKFATQQILPSFSDCRQAKVVAFVTGDPAKGRALAAQYGVDPQNICGYDEMDKLREMPVEAAYIITPNALHRPHTLAALKAGKHVLCEKPMATSSSDCETMIKAARDANKKLMIAYRAQYEPFNLECIRLCRSGELGRLNTITSDHGRQLNPSEPADRWRADKELAGGGSLVDIGIYSLQAARYLTGEEPIEVLARIESPENDPRFREVECTVHWTMRFPSGALANLSSSYDWHDTKRFRVQGSDAWLELDPATDYYKHRLRVGRPGKDGQTRIEEPQITEQNQFARQIDHMAECIRENKTPRTPGEEGLRDVRYMEGIYEAGRTGKLVKLNG
ncbi:MAG: Gfo/Idh/MocA family oxidoreductase [Armatimonadaceae bacterium]